MDPFKERRTAFSTAKEMIREWWVEEPPPKWKSKAWTPEDLLIRLSGPGSDSGTETADLTSRGREAAGPRGPRPSPCVASSGTRGTSGPEAPAPGCGDRKGTCRDGCSRRTRGERGAGARGAVRGRAGAGVEKAVGKLGGVGCWVARGAGPGQEPRKRVTSERKWETRAAIPALYT